MKTPNIVLNFEEELNQYLNLVQAHNAIHPDRDECGGVGKCLMMRTECQQEQELFGRYLAGIADAGYRLHVTIRSTDD